MKLKTWHLFAVIIILFGCSFYVINQKFDKFYRVNGINNDNRVLLEKYLDEDEQTFLIDNQINIDLFIDYLEEDDFYLQNYQYYNQLKNSNRYTKKKDIIDVGNSLSTRLTYLYADKALSYAKELIDNELELAFLNENNFQFDYIQLYIDMKRLYNDDDYSYIADTHTYISRLNVLGITGKQDLEDTFAQLTTAYTKDSLSHLMKKKLASDMQLVYNPYELTTLVDKNHYIGYYEPSGLLLTQDVPRVRYAMYLQNDAYNALIKMYQDLSQDYSGFVLKEAYKSAQSLDDDEVGINEYQLGLTISVTQSEVAYKDFETTDISKWLEQHAYEYGFILRYPKNKASVTDHAYDSHIYRYVGKSLAKSLFDSNLTLEEYLYMEE